MAKTFPLLLLSCLGACASSAIRPDSEWTKPTLTGMPTTTATTAAEPQKENGGAPDTTMMPIGIGLTTGPSTVLVGATLDFPLDNKLTFGPSLLYGFDNDVDLLAVTAQLKYFLPISTSDSGSFSILPYVTGGVGFASIDKQGSSGDTGFLLDVGAGLRYLTGENFRIGSEARLNVMPDKVAGESTFLSFELLQVVLSF